CEEDSNEIGLCGRGAGTPATSSVVLSPNSCPSNSKVGLHMMGHSLGLYGIDPGNPAGENRGKKLPGQCQLHGNSCKGPNSDDCEPQDEAASYIMSFCNQDRRYGPSATAHLRDVLDRYLWGGCR
ncbi:MAG: hypothetical protein SVV03_00320, partial [Candidatus Nanohaloarchaea archaeon]|nr:hypothetical protein [Candidatus Nanohaloarchaea archaeon]